MSLIIKGMELPKSCDSCDLIQFDDEGFEAHCPLSPYYRWCGTPPDYRPEGCRLVEIPTPHGRLIDADAAIARLKHLYCDGCGCDCSTCQWGAFIKYLDNRPTIIEAEK